MYLEKLGTDATVLTAPDSKGDMNVQAGPMKLKANIKEVLLSTPKPAENAKKSRYEPRKPSGSSIQISHRRGEMELDVRGMTVEEALNEMDLFIDGARLNSIKNFSIIHGKGTGALRSAVQSELKRIPDVKEFRLGRYGEGEDGVTIVTLK